MTSSDQIYDGNPTPSAPPCELRAGPLTLLYDDGDLRSIRLGGREVVRRIYFALRDRNWDTVPNKRRDELVEAGEDRFRIHYAAENRQGEVAFSWEATITGAPDGTVTFAFDGEARADYLHSRTGFCLLHPLVECAGQACEITRGDGTVVEGVFPAGIRPEQPVEPFSNLAAMRYEVAPGLCAEITFSGDLFEMEDQRNWTDASYKTFCTPLRLGYPRPMRKGERVCQSITLRVIGEVAALVDSAEASECVHMLRWTERPLPLPALGLALSAGATAPSAGERQRLAALNLAHLRVDLDLTSDAWLPALENACATSAALAAPLEIALYYPPGAPLGTLLAALERLRPQVVRWLVFDAAELVTAAETARTARAALADYAPDAVFVGGSKADLYELNAAPPALESLDAVVYSINPQTHAADNLSLIETLEAQAATVETARGIGQGRPVSVSPVTLKPRFNPYAVGPAQPTPPGELPPQVDPRQASLFGAGWTLGSIKRLTEAGAASVTYYETVGACGVMETEAGTPYGDKFLSRPGGVFPLYHVFADIAEFANGEVLPATSSDPLQFDGLLLRRRGRQGERLRLLLANLTLKPQTVVVPQWQFPACVRVLDETTAELAMAAPDAFRAAAEQYSPQADEGWTVALAPFAYACIDKIEAQHSSLATQGETMNTSAPQARQVDAQVPGNLS